MKWKVWFGDRWESGAADTMVEAIEYYGAYGLATITKVERYDV